MSGANDELEDVVWGVIRRSPAIDTAEAIKMVADRMVRLPGWSEHTYPRCQRPSYLSFDSADGRQSSAFQRDWIRMLIADARAGGQRSRTAS